MGTWFNKCGSFAKHVIHAIADEIAKATSQYSGWRKWQTGIGPIVGKAGEIKSFEIQPQCLFRVEKMYLSDGASSVYASDANRMPESKSFIIGIVIGQQNQMPNNTSIPVWAFGPALLGNGVEWDTCQGAYKIVITFKFEQDCTVVGALFGSAYKGVSL